MYDQIQPLQNTFYCLFNVLNQNHLLSALFIRLLRASIKRFK